MQRFIGSVIGFIVTTFLLAIIYGLYVTTVDFMGPSSYDPVASGRKAGAGVYSLFGVTAEEIEHQAPQASPKTSSVAHRIAVPYAVTADLSALLGGKLEIGIAHIFRGVEKVADKVAPEPNAGPKTATR